MRIEFEKELNESLETEKKRILIEHEERLKLA
jgi:hypothetical protein